MLKQCSGYAGMNTVLLGDFNAYLCNDKLEKESGYENIFRPHEYTNILETDCYDNIMVHRTSSRSCTEHKVEKNDEDKCKRFNIIKTTSNHYPIWADFDIAC